MDRKGIAVKLRKGVVSKLDLTTKNAEQIRLIYNPLERTPTGIFFPDNMLEITKTGNRRAYHYIFDAKYRYSDDEQYLKRFTAPEPPEDAINRMHAYRDQLAQVRHIGSGSDFLRRSAWAKRWFLCRGQR